MISLLNYQSYRLYLRDLLLEKATERKLSLRAFARLGSISPSYLSRVISGQRQLSVAAASKLSYVLDLGPEEESHMMRLLAAERLTEGSRVGRLVRQRVAATKKNDTHTVNTALFQTVADWQHFAILSLMNLADFRPDAQWIGQRLGIPADTARAALDRLLKMGLAKKERNTIVAVNEGEVETLHDTPSQAVRENHRQHLALAEAALRDLQPELREFANTTMSLAMQDLPKAKRRIRLFLDRFIRDLERKPGQELFQFNLQFYQLTKPAPRRKS